jgi:hypothetical protein
VKTVLDGNHLYENGKSIGPLSLSEGQRSRNLTIIERLPGSWSDLKQTTLSESEKALTEARSPGVLLVLEGLFQLADAKNANNRIYPNSLWDKILADQNLQRKVAQGEMLGECDHPRDGETLLQRVACMVTHFGRGPDNPKEIVGRMVVFNTEPGRNIKAIHEGGGRIGVSSRGSGSVVRQDGVDVVQDDYMIETWDIVHNPSTPGAYPDIRTESSSVSESKEMLPMVRLQDVADRFNRYRKRNISELSEDAVGLVREEISQLREILVTEDFGKDSPKAAALIAEVVMFQNQLGETIPPSKVESKDEKPTNEDVLFESDTKRDSIMWENAEKIAAKSEYKDKDALAIHLYKKMVGVDSTLPRAGTVAETIQLIEALYTGKKTDIRETTRLVREAYRDAVKLEGPLGRHELEGISRFVNVDTVTPANQREESVVKAKVTTASGTITERTYPSRAAVMEDLKNHNAILVEIADQEEIYEECAKKFQPLLETQTLKALNAVNETAKIRSSNSALSAKVAAAVQVIDNLVTRVKRSEFLMTEREKDLRAAVAVVDALAEETGVERMRGAIQAIAATHPHLPNLVEALSVTTSLEDAIRVTNQTMLDSLPDISREPTIQNKKFTEAITKSKEATQQADKRVAGELTYTDSRRDGIKDLTDSVISLMNARGNGR